MATDAKSNKITVIPKLLAILDIEGRIVTIDAMGYQRAIARQIIDQEGDYVPALKDNQGTLHDDVRIRLLLEGQKTTLQDAPGTVDGNHGRD